MLSGVELIKQSESKATTEYELSANIKFYISRFRKTGNWQNENGAKYARKKQKSIL